MWTLIRLLLKEQSDLGPRYLLETFLKKNSIRLTADGEEGPGHFVYDNMFVLAYHVCGLLVSKNLRLEM